jgi:ribonuclease P protein component
MMLASIYKIKKNREIEEIKFKGKMYQSPNFGVVVLKREGQAVPRFVFIISTKISKKSVHRNRINRALNEGARRSVTKVPNNYDFVFLTKKSIEPKLSDEIIKEVENFLSSKVYIQTK